MSSLRIILLSALLAAFASAEIFSGKLVAKQGKTKDWWQSALFYQIYPRSFKDSNDDGIGDIRGIISKLPYLKETGVTATWLSPIFKSPQADFGYDISDFTQVDPIFGTNADLEELFTEAHKLDIKIIMDFVPNHTSDEHEWFIKSAAGEKGFENFYVWHDGFPSKNGGRPEPPNQWASVFSHSAWKWNDQREAYYLHQFATEQPDLNYREPRVVQAMKDVLTFWMDKGADGFRVDAVNHLYEDPAFRNGEKSGMTEDEDSYDYLTHEFSKDLDETYDMVGQWRELIDAYNAEKGGSTRVIFIEAYTSVENTVRFYADAKGKPRAHFPFNFFLIGDLDSRSTARSFQNTINKWMRNMPEGATPNWVLGNHDQPRLGSRFGEEKIDGLLTLLLTLPGVAVTYNGEEIGMMDYREITWLDTQDPQACNTNDPDNFMEKSRDPQRTPFQWDATDFAGFKGAQGKAPWVQVHPNYQQINLAAQLEANTSYYKFYKSLAALRTKPTFVNGAFESKVINDEVLGIIRTAQNEPTYVTLINFSDKNQTVDVNDAFGTNFLKDKSQMSVMEVAVAGSKSARRDMDSFPTTEIILAPYEALVVTQYSSGVAIKLSAFIFIVAVLRNLF